MQTKEGTLICKFSNSFVKKKLVLCFWDLRIRTGIKSSQNVFKICVYKFLFLFHSTLRMYKKNNNSPKAIQLFWNNEQKSSLFKKYRFHSCHFPSSFTFIKQKYFFSHSQIRKSSPLFPATPTPVSDVLRKTPFSICCTSMQMCTNSFILCA